MEEEKTEKSSVLTEGIIGITLNESKLNIVDIFKEDIKDVPEFTAGIGKGEATGIVSLNTGGKAIIKLQLEGAVLFSEENYKKGFLGANQIKPGENYYNEALLRIFLLITEFIAHREGNWLIIGYTKNDRGGKFPITIIYSPILQTCFYSMKRRSDVASLGEVIPGFNA